ncbi:glutamyl-tRNA reductase [Saccharicrinis aurantiacus]|uniref:glutamyl-tRNA reductase n=1 Tax=Saccharicrinis aurantiacus TaxID=1849719 RepID=UPI000838C726|nr:glutamyl-tRNA reductase [Saccharicrinis aurantiacus]
MIGILGLNHKTASIDVRDKFSIAPDKIIPTAEYLMQHSEITGIVIIATCNRTEIYYSRHTDCTSRSRAHMLKKVHEVLDISEDYSDYFYHYSKADAIKHLFTVISGVDSMVIGENQIVNQIKNAYLTATEANLTDAVLMRMFQKAFECSKRVRSETEIQKGATSIGYVANDLCEKEATDFKNSKVLIIGAGETGVLSLQNLKHRGVKHISITNRTNEKALEVANNLEANPILFANFHEHLSSVDIIITATNAGKYLISKEDVEKALHDRDNKKQWYIDLSVPRNIDKNINSLTAVKLFSVDDLQKIVDSHSEKRALSVDGATIIIDELVSDSIAWLNSRSLRPVINSITNNLQELSAKELNEYKNNLTPELAKEIEKYTNLLTQKCIRSFIRNLKDVTKNGESTKSLDSIEQLFKFDS